MNALNSRQSMIDKLSALHRGLEFTHFVYHGRDKKSIFRCKYCGLWFRQSIDSLLNRRRNGQLATTACGCRLDIVKEWDLPDTPIEGTK